jgi:hypothetical protein
MSKRRWRGKLSRAHDATLVLWTSRDRPRRLLVELRPAPGARGVEVTLKVPGGAGHGKLRRWLMRAKSLLEAGQVPTGGPG